jgi:hypothetical protein
MIHPLGMLGLSVKPMVNLQRFPRTVAMTNKIPTQRAFRVFSRLGSVFTLTTVTLCTSILFGMGCGGQTMVKPAVKHATDGMLYQVTAQEALDLAQWAVAQVLPDQTMMRLKKPRLGLLVHEAYQPGHYKYARFRESDYIYEIDLIRSEGHTPQGDRLTGYTYTIKGSGDLKGGSEKVVQIDQHLAQAFGQTGRAAAVSSLQPAVPGPPSVLADKPPVSKERSPTPPASPLSNAPPEKPMVKEAPVPMDRATAPSVNEDIFVKLKKLKELRDQEIITEKEFQETKKALLERI